MINLGIKVPPEILIRAFQEHQPDAIGLSGLLVKSTQQMVITASDLKDAGIDVPLLVGGAALSEKFTRTQIAPGLWRRRLLRQGRHDRPAPDEPAHGPRRARRQSCAIARYVEAPARSRRLRSRRRAPASRRTQPQSAHRYPDSARAVSRPQGPRRAAPRRSVELHQSVHALRPPPRLTRAISKRRWPSTMPKALELFHNVEEVKPKPRSS